MFNSIFFPVFLKISPLLVIRGTLSGAKLSLFRFCSMKYFFAFLAFPTKWIFSFGECSPVVMKRCVVLSCNYFEILNSVVQFITISMVYYFMSLKFSSYKFFKYFSMFKDMLSVSYKKFISGWGDASISHYPTFPNKGVAV